MPLDFFPVTIHKPESLDLIKDLEDILKEIKKLSKG